MRCVWFHKKKIKRSGSTTSTSNRKINANKLFLRTRFICIRLFKNMQCSRVEPFSMVHTYYNIIIFHYVLPVLSVHVRVYVCECVCACLFISRIAILSYFLFFFLLHHHFCFMFKIVLQICIYTLESH